MQDYPSIVKHPMDLGTMRTRLQRNEYTDPWAICDDFRLMVDNACLYNKRTSRVHRAALKVQHAARLTCSWPSCLTRASTRS